METRDEYLARLKEELRIAEENYARKKRIDKISERVDNLLPVVIWFLFTSSSFVRASIGIESIGTVELVVWSCAFVVTVTINYLSWITMGFWREIHWIYQKLGKGANIEKRS